MWKQFKKEIIAGGLVIAVLSFALGCVFNDSMERSKYHTMARLEQGSDKGINDQCPGGGGHFDQSQGRQGHRGSGRKDGQRPDGQRPPEDDNINNNKKNQDNTVQNDADNQDDTVQNGADNQNNNVEKSQ